MILLIAPCFAANQPITLEGGITSIWDFMEAKSRFPSMEHVTSVTDTTHAHGMFGLGTGWNQGQFDNLSLSRN